MRLKLAWNSLAGILRAASKDVKGRIGMIMPVNSPRISTKVWFQSWKSKSSLISCSCFDTPSGLSCFELSWVYCIMVEEECAVAEVGSPARASSWCFACPWPWNSCSLWAAGHAGVNRQIHRGRWSAVNTRANEALLRQRCREILQKIRSSPTVE